MSMPHSQLPHTSLLPSPSPLLALLRTYLHFALLMLCLLGAARIGLILWQWDRVQAVDGLGTVLLQGVRFDLVSTGLVFILPILVGIPLLTIPLIHRQVQLLARSYFFGMATLLIFLELATPSFIHEYDTRPNFLFVEYLKYPAEVLSTVWGAYRWPLIVVIALSLPGLLLLHRQFFKGRPLHHRLELPSALLAFLILAPLSFAMVRSTLAHRAVNPSVAAFSSDPLVNSLCLPSGYQLGYAIYETLRHESSGNSSYGRVDYPLAIEAQRRAMGLPSEAFISEDSPLLHHQAASLPRERPLNLVVLLQESLGAEFVGSLGGLPLTPEIDRWSQMGMNFERLYATGTRSVRGIEAVITGFPPTTSRAVVKLPRSQRGFFTLAELLRDAGYATSFIYGGGAHFDNMGRFFSGNGFERIIDEDDYSDPVFTGSWGVSDEDLFTKAHAEFTDLHRRGESFFSLVFSSSNHSPFEFPEGRIELYEEPAATRHNASKYADWALGRFLDQASRSEYWEDTVFLVVADHCSRVYGSALVPVEHFHVPGFFVGGSVAPQSISTLASQLDLLPSALSLIGLSADHPAPGRDLTLASEQAKPGGAILQYYDTRAQIFGDDVIILRPNLPPAGFLLKGETLIPVEQPKQELVDQARALAAWPSESYQRGDYRLHKARAGHSNQPRE